MRFCKDKQVQNLDVPSLPDLLEQQVAAFEPFSLCQNIARIANAVPCPSLFKGHNVNVDIVVLNCHKCNQCLKCQVSGHKSLGLLSEGAL